MSTTKKAAVLLLILVVSPTAYAAESVSWISYLFIVMSISIVIASILSARNQKVDSRMGRVLLTGLYFWVLTFAQLMGLALIYYLSNQA